MFPGLSTANAPANSCPCSRIAAETTAAFVAGARPHNRISRTPVDACRCRKTSSPKSSSTGIGAPADIRLSIFIHNSSEHLGYARNPMAIEAKALDNLTVNAFIGEERHRGIVSRG
jgi:hypothetical protein